MALTIPDEVLRQAGMTESEARIEIACRLFDAGRISFPAATRLAGVSRPEFERELDARNLPIYRPTRADLADDLTTLEQLGH